MLALVKLAPSQSAHLDLVRHAPNKTAYFADNAQPTGLDLQAIEDSTTFSMRLKDARADNALLASGAALAAGKTSLYWVEERKQLPWFLQEADLTYPHQVCIVEGNADPAQALEKTLNQPAHVPPPIAPHDAFLGCLMSGLDKAQYAEGQSHLLQIDKTLRERLHSPDNYCEGINVKSKDSFDTPRQSLAQDIKALQGSRNCIFYAYDGQSRPSGMWVEAGYAIEKGKPCTFLVPTKDCLPEALRQDHLPANVQVFVYGDHAQFLHQLETAPEAWLNRP